MADGSAALALEIEQWSVYCFLVFHTQTDKCFSVGTILTAIPSRTNMCMADDLLETTREGVLHNVSSSDDLMKHIVKEAIIFPNKFMRAGLGEHILDIFEGEIASEVSY